MKKENEKIFNYSLVYREDIQKFESKAFYQGLVYHEMIAALGSINIKSAEIINNIVDKSLTEDEKNDLEKVAESFASVENDIYEYVKRLIGDRKNESKAETN
jgi:hypothetical protein